MNDRDGCVAQDYTPPSGELKAAIESQWKTLDNFTAKFNASTAAVQVRAECPHTPVLLF